MTVLGTNGAPAGNATDRGAVTRAVDPSPGALRWAGLCGSVLLMVGSLGAGALPVYDPVSRTPVLRLLRQGGGPDVALGMVYGGLALLCLAWLYIGRAVRRGLDGTGTGDLIRTFLMWAAPLLLAAPLFSRDMYSYAAQAQLTHAGLDPYTNGPAALPGPFLDEVQRLWVDTPAPYGPLWLSMVSLIAAVTGKHVLLTVLSMRALAVLGVVLIARYLPRLAAYCGADGRAVLWLVLLNPLLLVHFVAGGHNDALMLGLMIAGAVIALESTTRTGLALGVAVVTLAVLVKAPAAIAVAFLAPVWARRLTGPRAWLRGTAWVGAVSLTTFAGITMLTGLGVGWIHQLGLNGDVKNWLSIPTGLGFLVIGAGDLVGIEGHNDTIIDTFRLVGQAVTAVVLVLLWARSFAGRPIRALAVALTVVVVLGPVVQPWYLLWALAFAAVIPLPEKVLTVAAGASVYLALLITPQGATLFNVPLPAVATGVATLVVTYVVLGRGHEPGRRRAAPQPSPA